MTTSDSTVPQNGGVNPATVKTLDLVSDAANQVKDKVAQAGRAAVETVDQGRTGAAQSLQGSAQSVRSAGKISGEAITNAANKTAETLESTARYVREHDFQSMMSDVKEVVRRNPTPSLICGVAIGFLAGAALLRRK